MEQQGSARRAPSAQRFRMREQCLRHSAFKPCHSERSEESAQVLSFRRPRFLAFARNDKLFESPVLGPVSEQLVSAATSRTPCGRGKAGQELSPSPRPYSNPCEPQRR